jgi:hypothetical protein
MADGDKLDLRAAALAPLPATTPQKVLANPIGVQVTDHPAPLPPTLSPGIGGRATLKCIIPENFPNNPNANTYGVSLAEIDQNRLRRISGTYDAKTGAVAGSSTVIDANGRTATLTSGGAQGPEVKLLVEKLSDSCFGARPAPLAHPAQKTASITFPKPKPSG